MSKKGTIEVFQSKITRNDRFAQMSHQEKVIEQKKKEIQAKLEQKQKGQPTSTSDTKVAPVTTTKAKSPVKLSDKKHGFNLFSNDGSFLDQFKQLKDKKTEHKSRFYRNKDGHDKCFSDERNKTSRWSQKRGSQSPKDVRATKPRTSRFSDKINFEPKINITTTYSTLLSHSNFDPISPQNVTGQPLLKNMIPPPGVVYPTPPTNESVIAAPPVLLNMPPPQLVQNSISAPIVVTSTTPLLSVAQNIITPTTVLTTVNLPPPPALPNQNATILSETVVTASVISVPPPCVPTIELASIPPPNPIQVHNIPQPEPINTLTIPPPAPIQVQNIPPPSPIQLNEIPNPKPLDILNIPTPSDNNCIEKNISNPDFIKNIPPPNKSVPPPTLSESNVNVNVNISMPPPPSPEINVGPSVPTCLPPPNVIPPTSMPPPQQTLPLQPQNISVQNVPPPQTILVQSIPPPQPISQLTLQTLAPPPPPPPLPQVTQNLMQINPNSGNITVSAAISLTVPIQNQVGVTPVGVPPPPVTVTNTIPSLMAQPVLPPPGMGIAPPINMNCPPPLIQNAISCSTLQAPPPTFVNQPPPLTSQMPPMNVPPPNTAPMGQGANIVGSFRDINTVFPPGTADYEAMASLGRMVAQCGRGIEDIVRQRKTQDPSLWFVFHKESAAYHQYEQLVEQFKMEMGKCDDKKKEENFYKPEDTYEPEIMDDEEMEKNRYKPDDGKDNERSGKRKRKSRWGDKDTSVPPPVLIVNTPPTSVSIAPTGGVLLSKITRNDPALIQYAINTFGSANLSEEDWRKAEDHFKINILYQEMLKKRQEVENMKLIGKNKYEYDSDEEIEGGTWEHKLREKEMFATQQWANELNRQAEGKHHIGDFLPPEELQKFLEKSVAVKEGRQPSLSDYKEFKLKEDNIGFKMLQKLGWSEGQGLGSNGSGIIEPVNKGTLRDQNQGLGLEQPDRIDNNDDEYESYRKRMMLAYRFRPNPLNNPRRPYY